jgi:hypothetical protein
MLGARDTRLDCLERRIDAALDRVNVRVAEIGDNRWEQGRENNELRWELRRELTEVK